MAYRVQILARYGDFEEEDNTGRIIFEGIFGDEEVARKVIGDYMADARGKLEISKKFNPDYFTANLFHRGELGETWSLLFSESLPL